MAYAETYSTHRIHPSHIHQHPFALSPPGLPLNLSSIIMPSLVWFITGATSGIGAALVEQVIARGDRVIASGRKVQERLGHLKLERLEFLELDITSSTEEIQSQAAKAWDIFGHIDVLMNNAGMSAMKSAEEAEYVLPLVNFKRCMC
jgi:short subunit dehydrogenase